MLCCAVLLYAVLCCGVVLVGLPAAACVSRGGRIGQGRAGQGRAGIGECSLQLDVVPIICPTVAVFLLITNYK
jgi:hypothetical protein